MAFVAVLAQQRPDVAIEVNLALLFDGLANCRERRGKQRKRADEDARTGTSSLNAK